MNAEQQRLMANQRKMEAEIQTAMDSTKYPAGLVPNWFKGTLSLALDHESQRTLGCDWAMLKSIRSGDPEEFTMSQMGHALNSIESKTPASLLLHLPHVITYSSDLSEFESEEISKTILDTYKKSSENGRPLIVAREGSEVKGSGIDLALTYDTVQDKVFEMATKWNEIMGPIKEGIAKKYQNLKPLFVPNKKKIHRP